MPVTSSVHYFQPPTPENLQRFVEHGYVCVKTKDGMEYGGDTFTMRFLDNITIRLYQDPYFGGRWHHIPINEIEGICAA